MGEIIIASDYEGVEGVLRIQTCLLAGSLAPLLMSCLNRHIPDLADPGIVFRYKYHFVVCACNLGNADLQREKIFLLDIFYACIHIHQYKYCIVYYLIYF